MSSEPRMVVDPFSGALLCQCGQVHHSADSLLSCKHPDRRPPVVPGLPLRGPGAHLVDPYETAVVRGPAAAPWERVEPAPRPWWRWLLGLIASMVAGACVCAGGFAVGTATGPWGIVGGVMMICGAGTALGLLYRGAAR